MTINKDSIGAKILLDFVNVRSILTLGAFGIAYFLAISNKEFQAFVLHVCDIMLGFWFGQKVAQAIEKSKEGAK